MKRVLPIMVVVASLLMACGGATPAATTVPAATNAPEVPAATTAPEAPAATTAPEAPAATTAPAEPAATTPPSTGAGEDVEITYMMWGSPEELAIWQQIIDDFQKANPNVKIKLDISDWESYWNKLKTLHASATPPDVFAMDGPLYPDWASRGVLLDLQPYIDKTPGMLDGLYPNTLSVYKRSDGFYGLPRDLQPIVLYYNKDMFDKAGIAYPTDKWTMDDMREAAKKLTQDTNGDGKVDQWGFTADLWDMELFWSEAIWSYGGEVISQDYSKTLLAEGAARDAWKFINGMMVEDKSMPDPNVSAEFGGDAFAAGVAAMTTIGHWVVPQYSQLGFKWDVAPIPAGPKGRVTSINSAALVMSKDTKHADAAWEFIKFALGESGQTRMTELGFAVPIYKSVAESPVFLKQKSAAINQQVFLDAIGYAKAKPAFKGYEEWAAVIGDGLVPVWNGEKTIDAALDEIVPQADEVLQRNK